MLVVPVSVSGMFDWAPFPCSNVRTIVQTSSKMKTSLPALPNVPSTSQAP